GDGSSGGGTPSTTAQPEVSIGELELTVGGVIPANAGPAVPVPPELAPAVLASVATYVDGGLIQPIREGEVAPDVAAVFEAGAAAQLEGPDRGALFDEGLPEVTTAFTPTAQPVTITALSDGTGTFVIATALLQYVAELGVADGTLTVTRTAELTMIPEAEGWRITSYDVVVTRDGPGIAPTTTTVASA
ncbi:MAG TPA: hypothetical protein VF152_07590, partial [Acidimicrobiia bacterium]